MQVWSFLNAVSSFGQMKWQEYNLCLQTWETWFQRLGSLFVCLLRFHVNMVASCVFGTYMAKWVMERAICVWNILWVGCNLGTPKLLRTLVGDYTTCEFQRARTEIYWMDCRICLTKCSGVSIWKCATLCLLMCKYLRYLCMFCGCCKASFHSCEVKWSGHSKMRYDWKTWHPLAQITREQTISVTVWQNICFTCRI